MAPRNHGLVPYPVNSSSAIPSGRNFWGVRRDEVLRSNWNADGSVDLQVEVEGGQDEQWNRGCAWLRMNAKSKVERQETGEDKTK
jgi:hypothetical protein